ncbi:TetR/AcrR family transcriptional regulator [Actinokineospora sp.]|uniref:TetR/AcrR family transcriptional regulator n=1 Tax=Actinokineospora sp. TaxID=1872133 RepID=UPI004037D7CA
MASNSRERILRSAAKLFSTQGYHATGLNQVISEGGAPKGSLYFHFPGGKEELAAQAIALSGSELDTEFAQVLHDAPTPGEGIARVLGLLGTRLAESGFTKGCPVATTALDAASTSEPIRQACNDAFFDWQHTLTEHLTAHGRPDADTLSTVVLAAVEGALLLARTRRDLAPLTAVAAHLRTTLDG